MLQGKKTYLVAGLMIAYAVIGALTGQMDGNKALELMLQASGLGALRAGIKNG